MRGPRGSTTKAYITLALAVAGIAWSAIFVRWAGIPGAASAFYRVLVAGIVLLPWRLVRGSTRPVERRAVVIAIIGGIFFGLDLAFWNTSVMYTGAAVASILGNNTPVFVAILSWLLLHRRPKLAFWIGLSLSVSGCLTIMLGPASSGSTPVTMYGNLLAIGGSVCFAAYLITTERVRREMDTLTFNALAIAGSIVCLLVVCFVFRLPLWGYSGRAWASVIGLGLVSQLAAYYALVYALGHLPATITSVGLLAQVPVTAALAWLLLGEPLTVVQLAGGAVVIAGIYIVTRYS